MALQMSWQWQPNLLHHKRKSGPPLGLKNLGNSCYLNSVLQCLTYTPPLASFCLNSLHSSSCDSALAEMRECPFCILEKRIARSLSVDLTLDTPAKMNSCLRIFAEHFRFGRQEDAHEFLRYVIDACHNTCLRLKKLQQRRKGGGGDDEGFGGGTVVKEIFGGALQSQVKCSNCGAESNKVDEIMDISLDVLHSTSLKESMQKFFQAEVLDGNNKYKCENCKKLVTARKQMSLLQAPNVLVIQLKRFEGVFGGKIDKAIAFEEVLVLSSYVCKASQDTHVEYKLFGTIVHSGFSPDSGHYYAYIKDAMGRWYCCNDSYVKLSNLQEVLSEKVYILFFSCTKQRPGPANTALACNGVKSQECNGSDTSKSQKVGHSGKAVYTKQSVDHSFESDNLTRCQGPDNTALISNGVKSQECNGSDAAKGQKIAHSGKAVCAKQSVDHSFENDKLSRCPGPANTALASNRVKFQECNGSDVSKGQKVAHSEKAVYAKQSVDHSFENNNLTRCPGPANTALPSDGVKSECNGSDTSKGQKVSHSEKEVHTKQSVNHFYENDNLTRSEDNKVPFSGEANLSSFGKSGAKRFPASGNNGNNGETNMSLSKVNFNGNNGDVKASISAEKGEKNMSSSNGNGVTKSKTVEAIDNGNIQSFALANGNWKTKSMPADSVEAGIPEDNHGRNGVTTGTVANKQELKNGGVNCPSDISGLKRKFQDEDSCTLLTKDAHSQAKLEDFKEVLLKEASSGLRSCGWTEEVHRWMWSRKKVCSREASDTATNGAELKKMLMSEAKQIYISQIPESLKENLINHLRSFTWAWDLYYHVFRRIDKQLQTLTTLDLQSVSPELLECRNLELAVPGTYRADSPVVTISSFAPQLVVITSKQRPRKLTIHGSNGEDYAFLLKGHEDLRQDERVMQLFGLVNTLLENSRKTEEKDLTIQRYSVIPLSPNSGLIGWVPNCDTLHYLIREYRDGRKIILNQEHKHMLSFAPDYDHLPLIAKVEVFEYALQNTEGNDLARVLWLKSRTSEVWLDRRTNYTRSLAVMSMVGYLLGLGDRHPSNLMLNRSSGKILHIDFGDCFEASMNREKFPEKVPFRLTRMLVKAMEVSGIEGNFRLTCENVMQVLRTHKDSVMAMMEAFVHDPLINWRLFNFNEVPQMSTIVSTHVPAVVNSEETAPNRELLQPQRGAREREILQAVNQLGDANEVLNQRAVVVMARMSNKLTGRDFSTSSLGSTNSTQLAVDHNTMISGETREVEHGLSVKVQVQKLILQARSHENLCQNYVGWCPFW